MSAVPGSLKVTRSARKPAPRSTFSKWASAPPSAGVTDGQRMSACARATGSADALTALIPQKLVDGGLGARPFVDPLHDDGAVEARPRLAVRYRLARHRARDHDRVGRHLALQNLTAGAIDDFGGG